MKIKKLSIHGFKSFVDKTTLAFPSGTSGIIGPNGCGKSNIVDAIRWVLGEQNARHLRGKHMEDVIFNGSENRKPLGMAEVVLTFSNEGGLASSRFANFTEIEISRRLYRSGESEYYINKVQSRLRDIVDLFTDTGIGTRAYSIIEQGQVGWLINAKPEERRSIFEEAAGINKFKHKKDAALRRLESTRENLTRVSDIISEVKRQLNSLNRQAKKAERYKALKEELKELELTLSSLEFTKMREALSAVSKRLEAVKDEEIAAAALAAAKEDEAEELRVEHLGVEGEYKGIRERVFEAERAIQDEEKARALAAMRTEELRRAEERLALEIEEMGRGREGATREIEALRANLAELAALIEADSAKLGENSKALEAASSELRAREDAQRAMKAESFKISGRFSDIRHAIQNCIRDEEHLRAREARARTEIEAASAALASKEEPMRALRENIAGAGQRKDALQAELATVRQGLESLEKERAEKAREISRTKDEYSKASAMLATLEGMEKNFESLKGGAKAIMQRPDMTGVFGLIADCIETNPGFEKAVEAVLADKLQFVLVESHKEGVEAIEYLKARGAGRASFVPVSEARPSASPVPVQGGQSWPGTREMIRELRIREGYDSIVTCLLGDVFIADGMDAALAAWKESGGFKSFVTVEGEIIDAQGVMTGGSALSGSGILQRRGEIKKIRAKSESLAQDVSALEQALMSLDEKMQSEKGRIDGLRDRLHRSDIEKVNLSSELKRQEDEAERLRRTRDSLANETADAERRLAETANKKASLSQEREKLEGQLAEIEGKIAAISEQTQALSARKEEISAVVTEARVKLASSRERLESVKREIASRERSIEESGRRMESKKAEIERGRQETAAREQEARAIKERLEGLLSRIDAIRKEEVVKAESLEALAGQIRTIEHEIKEIKTRYSEAQELKGELTIELRETELAIKGLNERMQEKYSTFLQEYRPAEGEAVPDTASLETRREETREKIASLGEVSLSALEEYNDLDRRHQFLLDQQSDLTRSVESLHAAIQRINRTTREKFRTTFDEINAKFQETFPRFFSGGRAELRLAEEADVLEAGVEIVAQPPGKRLQNITLLSGGEKALTATALIFAIFLIKPSPFCLLDEVDAPLDDANIDRFNVFVRDMAQISQFLLITHNKKTMEMADALYGITMQEPGVSKMITLKF